MTRSSDVTRAGRQARIVALLSATAVHSQSELAALLASLDALEPIKLGRPGKQG